MNGVGKAYGTLICGFCLAAGTWLAGCSRPEPGGSPVAPVDHRLEIEAAAVQRSRIATTLETVGTLLPIRATTIVAEIDGVIKRLPESGLSFSLRGEEHDQTVALGLDIGTPVKAGEVLVELDARDRELELAKAEAQLRLAQARLEELLSWKRQEEIDQLQAAVDDARAAWELASVDLQRLTRLIASAAASEGELDRARATEQRARAVVAQAEAARRLAVEGPTPEQLAVGKAELAATEVAVAQSKRDLEKTVIRSPYDAVVTERFIDVGDRVTAMPRVEIMQIVDPRLLLAEIDVPERYSGLVRVDDRADVYAAGRSEPIPGTVQLINGRIDLQSRTYRVRIAIDNRQGLLKPGGLVRVVLNVWTPPDSLAVPRRAVTFADGRPAVFVYGAAGAVAYRPVRLGILNADSCQVLDGLSEGELVAVSNPAALSDGLSVRLKKSSGPRTGLSQVARRQEERR